MSKLKLGKAIVKVAIKQIKKVPGAVKKIAKAQRTGTKGTKGAKGRKSRRAGTKAAVIGNTRKANLGARSRRGGNIGKTAILPPVIAGGVLSQKQKKQKAPSITRTAHGPLKGGSPTPGPKKKRKPTPAGDFVRFSNPQKSGFVRDSKGNKIRTGKNTKAFKKRMQDRKMGGGK